MPLISCTWFASRSDRCEKGRLFRPFLFGPISMSPSFANCLIASSILDWFILVSSCTFLTNIEQIIEGFLLLWPISIVWYGNWAKISSFIDSLGWFSTLNSNPLKRFFRELFVFILFVCLYHPERLALYLPNEIIETTNSKWALILFLDQRRSQIDFENQLTPVRQYRNSHRVIRVDNIQFPFLCSSF